MAVWGVNRWNRERTAVSRSRRTRWRPARRSSMTRSTRRRGMRTRRQAKCASCAASARRSGRQLSGSMRRYASVWAHQHRMSGSRRLVRLWRRSTQVQCLRPGLQQQRGRWGTRGVGLTSMHLSHGRCQRRARTRYSPRHHERVSLRCVCYDRFARHDVFMPITAYVRVLRQGFCATARRVG